MTKEFKQLQENTDQQFLPIEDVKKDWATSPTETFTNKNVRMRRTMLVSDTESAFLKGQKISRTGVTTTYSIAAVDYLISVTSLAAAPTIGLPRPINVGPGKTYNIKDEVGGAGTTTITVVSQGEERIDGASSFSLSTNYESITFYTDGANWFIY